MTSKLKALIFALFVIVLATSCATPKKISYFEDTLDGSVYDIADTQIKLRPRDKISIIVNAQDPKLTNMFNLPIITQQVGTESTYSQSRGLSGYTVDSEGNIDFPVLGEVHVAGLTREQVAKKIKDLLQKEELLKNPTVTVEFLNLGVSVMGEVNRPGRFDITNEKLTVLDALTLAGDLTIYGERTNVKVIRDEEGKRHTYYLDLTSAEQVHKSPAFYLQQNDVIYVEPNDTKARQSTVNGNNIRSTSFWISLTSLLTSVALLFIR